MTNLTAERNAATDIDHPRAFTPPTSNRPGTRARVEEATISTPTRRVARKTGPARTALRPATVCTHHRSQLSPRLSILAGEVAKAQAREERWNRAAYALLVACAAGMGLACFSALQAFVTRGAMFITG